MVAATLLLPYRYPAALCLRFIDLSPMVSPALSLPLTVIPWGAPSGSFLLVNAWSIPMVWNVESSRVKCPWAGRDRFVLRLWADRCCVCVACRPVSGPVLHGTVINAGPPQPVMPGARAMPPAPGHSRPSDRVNPSVHCPWPGWSNPFQ